jgi:hypothetical protein
LGAFLALKTVLLKEDLPLELAKKLVARVLPPFNLLSVPVAPPVACPMICLSMILIVVSIMTNCEWGNARLRPNATRVQHWNGCLWWATLNVMAKTRFAVPIRSQEKFVR